jgi:hypothetical protein
MQPQHILHTLRLPFQDLKQIRALADLRVVPARLVSRRELEEQDCGAGVLGAEGAGGADPRDGGGGGLGGEAVRD